MLTPKATCFATCRRFHRPPSDAAWSSSHFDSRQVQQFQKLGDTGEADSAPFMSILYAGWQWHGSQSCAVTGNDCTSAGLDPRCFYGTFAYFVTQKSGFLVSPGAMCKVYDVYARSFVSVFCMADSLRSSLMVSGTLRLFYSNIAGAVLGIYYVWGFQRNCRDNKAGLVMRCNQLP